MTDFPLLLEALSRGAVEFIIVTGVAATAHGSAHVTGDLDVLGEVAGGGTYDALLPRSQAQRLFGKGYLFVNLETLIWLKRAAGRPKDLERVAELEALLEERKKP